MVDHVYGLCMHDCVYMHMHDFMYGSFVRLGKSSGKIPYMLYIWDYHWCIIGDFNVIEDLIDQVLHICL